MIKRGGNSLWQTDEDVQKTAWKMMAKNGGGKQQAQVTFYREMFFLLLNDMHSFQEFVMLYN